MQPETLKPATYEPGDKIILTSTGEIFTVDVDLSDKLEVGIMVKENIGRPLWNRDVRPAGRTREKWDQASKILPSLPVATTPVTPSPKPESPASEAPAVKRWLHQNLAKTRSLIQKWSVNRNVTLSATVDHIEVGPSHLILGLNLDCLNHTDATLSIADMQAKLYRRTNAKGLSPVLDDLVEARVLLHLFPLENFDREPGLKPFRKKPLHYFKLAPGNVHTERVRFICHQNFDIPLGTYTIDISLRDDCQRTYTRRARIHVENKMKYRASVEWSDPSGKR